MRPHHPDVHLQALDQGNQSPAARAGVAGKESRVSVRSLFNLIRARFQKPAPVVATARYYLVALARTNGEVLTLKTVLAPSQQVAIEMVGNGHPENGEFHFACWASDTSVPGTVSGNAEAVPPAAAPAPTNVKPFRPPVGRTRRGGKR
jgi:hypothetical protein